MPTSLDRLCSAGFSWAIRGTMGHELPFVDGRAQNPDAPLRCACLWTSAIATPVDFVIATAAFVLLVAWRTPLIAVVLACAAGGVVMR